MKKIVFLLIVSLFAYSSIQAQAIETGDQAVNIGIGFGGSMVTGDGSPSFNVSYEILPFEKVGIGFISIGGYGAYKRSNYNYGLDEYSLNYWVFGARGAYHFDFYDMNGLEFFKHFDVYAGVFAGFSSENIDSDINGGDLDDELNFRNDLFAGARYNFTENIGVFGEVSYGINNLVFGIDFLF
jgi:hypothetical protein